MNCVLSWIAIFRPPAFRSGHERPGYTTTEEPFQPVLWVRVNLHLLSGLQGDTLVQSQCPVTLSPYKAQREYSSFEFTSLLLVMGLSSCLY